MRGWGEGSVAKNAAKSEFQCPAHSEEGGCSCLGVHPITVHGRDRKIARAWWMPARVQAQLVSNRAGHLMSPSGLYVHTVYRTA